ncbi:MAG: BtpA/SgcQ family protein [Deltaproteobacteria bacterium]|nr:BtpA/SgcQ family protein [Deltaproteobacteria bacterium]
MLVGVIHLPPLPGSPRVDPRGRHGGVHGVMDRIVEGVRRDVDALARARFDAVVVENFGDAPFEPGAVSPITVAALSVCVRAAVDDGRLTVGVNVLRNDVRSALAIAAAAGASIVRVNVHVGAVVADQGIIEGRAHETMRERVAWGAERVAVWADVDVKHAAPLGRRPVEEITKDAVLRGLADAVLVTGAATGAKVDGEALAKVRSATRAPIYVASGAVPDDLPRLREHGADGVIVGSWLRRGGKAGGPIDRARAASFAKSFRRAFA